MSDLIDDANNQAELALQIQLRARRLAGPDPTGRCLHCDAELAPYLRWCDADCRNDYERVESAAKRNGSRHG